MEYKINVPYICENEVNAGYNYVKLRASEDIVLEPGERKVIGTGVRVAIPDGFEMQIVGNADFDVVNTPGTIDSDYRGEIGIIALNNLSEPIKISEGDFIARGIFAKVNKVDIVKKITASNQTNIACIDCTEGAKMPAYETEGAAGVDIASVVETVIMPNDYVSIRTGLTIHFPECLRLSVRARSGLAAKHGIALGAKKLTFRKTFGGYIIVEDLRVQLHNTSNEPFKVEKGMRIAQLVFSPRDKEFVKVKLEQVSELPSTARGTGGFGSTGIKLKK